MAHSNKHFEWLDNMLLPALILSVGLHMIGLVTLHAFRSAPARPSPPLEVVLQPPKLEPPAPPAPKPEPPKPEKPKSLPKKAPPPPPVEMPPLPTPQPRNVVSSHAPVATPPPPVMTASPTTDAESTFTAPSQESEKPKGPSQQDVDSAIGDYGDLLAREFAKHKQYPRIAQMRGWQGTVRIRLEVDANGIVTSSTVSESSNFEALDKQALEMASKVTPLPPRPEALRHRPFSITVPVVFRLE